MIIIDNPNVIADIVVMKSLTTKDTPTYTLNLYSKYSHKTYSFEAIDRLESPSYWRFLIDFSEAENDEYEYTLLNANNEEVSNGLIQLGLKQYKQHVCYDTLNECVFYEGK
ncbi:MAG: hypothetical protein J6W16_01235 [Methanobrevibacter sp.]|nr:hypothetical protein [Methanobrevibacter sp.]